MPNQKRYRMGMPSSHESSSTSINISGNSMMTEEGTLCFDAEKGYKRKKISHLRKTAQSKISTAAKKASTKFDTKKNSIAHKFDKVTKKMSSKNSSTKEILPTIENPNGATNAFEEKIAGLQEMAHQTQVPMENNVNSVFERRENLERLSEDPNCNTNAFEEKIAGLQELVHQTKVSMENNVNLVVERGANLERLSDRAETLATGSIEFKRKAEKVKRKTWCEMWKMRILLGSIISIIIIAFVVGPVVKLLHDHHKDNEKTPEFENTTAVFISS